MDFSVFVNDKTVKPKEKTAVLSQWILNNPEKLADLISFAKTAKDPVKATCIEAIEFATKINPEIASRACLDFVSSSLSDKAPRTKWESAKVVGNIARCFPNNLAAAIGNLLENADHPGTVVRWSAAFALGQIIKMKTALNDPLIPAVLSIIEREEKNSIKKIYLEALKKANTP